MGTGSFSDLEADAGASSAALPCLTAIVHACACSQWSGSDDGWLRRAGRSRLSRWCKSMRSACARATMKPDGCSAMPLAASGSRAHSSRARVA
jgi:hypothetical protein